MMAYVLRTLIDFSVWRWPVLALCLLTGQAGVIYSAGPTYRQEQNLLKNPGFEGNFKSWNSIPEIQVASDWTPWWYENPTHEPAYFRPEYKRALASQFPKRVLSGESAQQYFTFHASHLAGMYQQVFDVMPGQRYRFSIFTQVWSSLEDNPNTSVQPANPHLQIGIDPTGNWDSGSGSVIWSSEAAMDSVIDRWGQMVIETTAENNVITVFMRTNPDFANKHNDIYWDNASLIAVEPPPPTVPPATNTIPVTLLPTVIQEEPTITPLPPTNTATMTPSPVSTATNSPEPTRTPLPTATATDVPASATFTPSTPTPSGTPLPSPSAEATTIAVLSTPNIGVTEGVPTVSQSNQEFDWPSTLAAIGVAVALILLVIVLVILLRRRES